MIIGLVGYIGCGKGTVSDILVNDYGFSKFAFADSLKDAVSTIFGWERHLLEGDTEESREFREKIDPWWTTKLGYEVTPRLILQKMGTEACRHGIADNIWIAALERRIQGQDKVVVSDVRFPNEIDFIRSVGGVIVQVKRGPEPTTEEKAKMHISETAWSNVLANYLIHNDSTIEALKDSVKLVLTIEDKSTTMLHHAV